MICYIILHYMAYKETLNCVESIKINAKGEKSIIVIDNFSSNGTGEILKDYYSDDSEVEVILNKENYGFARGNNIAYRIAKEKYNPDFIVIMNNDIEIVTDSFAEILDEVYKAEKFEVLGPRIISTTYQINQNPKRLNSYKYEEVSKLNKIYEKNLKPHIILRVKCLIKSNKLLRKFVYGLRTKKSNIDYNVKYYNIPLHGSFLVFSRSFIEKKDIAFNENTFFYFETEILDYECNRDGYKTMYYPDIIVNHHHHISTDLVYTNVLEKTLFSNRCLYNSTLELLRIMEIDNS